MLYGSQLPAAVYSNAVDTYFPTPAITNCIAQVMLVLPGGVRSNIAKNNMQRLDTSRFKVGASSGSVGLGVAGLDTLTQT